MYLVSALLTFEIQCRRILSLLHLSTASKDVLINIMHIYVTVLNTDIGFINLSLEKSGLQVHRPTWTERRRRRWWWWNSW